MRNSDNFKTENSIRTYVQVLTLLSLLFFALSAFGASASDDPLPDLDRSNLNAEKAITEACPSGVKRYYIHQRDPRANPRVIPEFNNDGNPAVVGLPWRMMKAPRPMIGQTYLLPLSNKPKRPFQCKATEVYSRETCEVAYVVHFGGTPLPNQIARAQLVELRSQSPGLRLSPPARSIDPRRTEDAYLSASLDAVAAQMKNQEPIAYWQFENYRGRSWVGLPITVQTGAAWDFCDELELEMARAIVEL